MNINHTKRLERNLWLYAIIRLFAKRTYLPLIVIYAVVHSGVAAEQLGIIAAITAFVTLALEIPSGYISDHIGHKKAVIFGSFLLMIAPLGFVFAPNFYGILFASLVYFSGGAFHSGTMQAFLHETLSELGRDNELGNVMARAQRWSLFGNIFLIALVPLTYTIDPKIPFVIGTILQSFVFVASIFMTTPSQKHCKTKELISEGFFTLLRSVSARKEFLLFFLLGAITALHNKLPEYKELYFQDIGVPLWFFGIVYSLMGIFGIFLTYKVRKIEKCKTHIFYAFDLLIACFVSILVGLVSNIFIGVMLFVMLGGYYRIRSIIVYTYLLRDCPTQKLKATYLSMYAFFGAFNGIWIPVILGYAIGYFGAQRGYFIFGIGALMVLSALYFLYIKRLFSNQLPASPASRR